MRPEYFGSRTIRLSDPFSPLPLTPSTPLIGKTKLVLPPPGKFQRGNTYWKHHWRRAQNISNKFWNRWSKEYLQILQLTKKWTHKRRNFTEGDIVLLKDNNSCRNKGPIAKRAYHTSWWWRPSLIGDFSNRNWSVLVNQSINLCCRYSQLEELWCIRNMIPRTHSNSSILNEFEWDLFWLKWRTFYGSHVNVRFPVH